MTTRKHPQEPHEGDLQAAHNALRDPGTWAPAGMAADIPPASPVAGWSTLLSFLLRSSVVSCPVEPPFVLSDAPGVACELHLQDKSFV